MAYEALYTRGRPKRFGQLIGQEHIVNALTRAIASNRLSHAYLLVGTRGTGKTSTARLLAKAMNCDKILEAQQSGKTLNAKDIPCNECASCKSIDSSPDNVEFDAASNRSVDDVTRLLSTAYLAPLQSRVKTFIIDEVHMLSFEAVNSILKLIEEPPPNVAFFLATTELNKVPMTIRSRCQVLNFRLIPQDTISNYLIALSNRMNVELESDAAKKIARLAEGSMRDAMTYLDQCYAMADKKITLAEVNETLGLVSDADLDEIISAVKSKNRAEVANAINNAFRSGLSSISIAEALITRLRDLGFEKLNTLRDFTDFDNFVGAIRKAILEMQGSGIPDIILEMTLMKLTAPVKIESQQINSAIPDKPIEQKPSKISLTGNLDEDKKIIYDIIESFKLKNSGLHKFLGKMAVIFDVSNDTVTLAFKSDTNAMIFNTNHKTAFAEILSNKIGRPIKIDTVIKDDVTNPKLDRINPEHRKFVETAMNTFHTNDFNKIDDKE